MGSYLVKFRRLLGLVEVLHDADYVMGCAGCETFKQTGVKLKASGSRDSVPVSGTLEITRETFKTHFRMSSYRHFANHTRGPA